MMELWQDLDADGSGEITLDEIDQESTQLADSMLSQLIYIFYHSPLSASDHVLSA